MRARFRSIEPVFWFRPETISGYYREIAYFVGLQSIIVIQLPLLESRRNDKAHPTVSELPDNHIIAELMRSKDRKDLALEKGRIALTNPEIATFLSDYLAAYPYDDVWEQKFPGIIVEGVSPEEMYEITRSAGDILAAFVKAIGRELSKDVKQKLDDLMIS